MEMTEETMQVLEATIIRMFVHESGATVFYITEPEIQENWWNNHSLPSMCF